LEQVLKFHSGGKSQSSSETCSGIWALKNGCTSARKEWLEGDKVC